MNAIDRGVSARCNRSLRRVLFGAPCRQLELEICVLSPSKRGFSSSKFLGDPCFVTAATGFFLDNCLEVFESLFCRLCLVLIHHAAQRFRDTLPQPIATLKPQVPNNRQNDPGTIAVTMTSIPDRKHLQCQ